MKNKNGHMKAKLILMVLFLFSFSGCQQKEQKSEIQVMEADKTRINEEQTLEVTKGSVENYILLNGNIVPNVYQIKFETTGKFKEYKVNLGDSVTKGQVIAVLEDTDIPEKINELTRKLEDLKAAYEFNIAYCNNTIAAYKFEMEADRMIVNKEYSALGQEETNEKSKQVIYTKLAIEKEELKKSQIEQLYQMEKTYAQEQLNMQQEKLSKLQITAPCDGDIIALQEISQGDDIKKEDYYAAIAEKDSYYIQTDYFTQGHIDSIKEIYALRGEKKYNIKYVPMPEEVYFAILNNEEEKYSNFSIENKDEDIRYGNKVFIKVVNYKSENVLVIPNICIETDQEGAYVYKQTENKKEKVYVKLGLTDKIITEVKEGLEEGDIIYVQK